MCSILLTKQQKRCLNTLKKKYVINQHGEEGSVKGDRIYVEPRGGHRCVHQKTTQRAVVVKKVSINWDESQKFTYLVNAMYSSRMSANEK